MGREHPYINGACSHKRGELAHTHRGGSTCRCKKRPTDSVVWVIGRISNHTMRNWADREAQGWTPCTTMPVQPHPLNHAAFQKIHWNCVSILKIQMKIHSFPPKVNYLLRFAPSNEKHESAATEHLSINEGGPTVVVKTLIRVRPHEVWYGSRFLTKGLLNLMTS